MLEKRPLKKGFVVVPFYPVSTVTLQRPELMYSQMYKDEQIKHRIGNYTGSLQPCTCISNSFRQKIHDTETYLDYSNRIVSVLYLPIHSTCNKDSLRQQCRYGY